MRALPWRRRHRRRQSTRRVLDAKDVFVSIADGREKNGIRMPAWREVLSDQEIWQATAYVLSICKKTP